MIGAESKLKNRITGVEAKCNAVSIDLVMVDRSNCDIQVLSELR